MAVIIDGKLVSKNTRDDIRNEALKLRSENIVPGLAVVIVGDNQASRVYVNNKKKGCEEVGFLSREYALPESTSQTELIDLIKQLSDDKEVDGILVQLPLPKHIDEQEIILSIPYNKDVDAFHPTNVGKIMIGNYDFLPCTPAGIMELLDYYKIDPTGKSCVVVGRSNIVGKPMAMLMLHKNATVTITHSKTIDLAKITRQADILVVAIGRAKYITGDMIKDGAVVIDVGMNRDENNKLCGDVDFDSCEKKASYITPVPGGVGPMTITMLLKNTLKSAQLNKKRK